MKKRSMVALALVVLSVSAFAQSEMPVDLAVPFAPAPFEIGGKKHLVYELQVWNYAAPPLLLKRLDVLSDTGLIASWEGANLHALFFGGQDVLEDGVLRRGMRGVAYLWITLEASAPLPKQLRHRLTAGDEGASLEGAAVLVSTAAPVLIGPPLRGANWLAANGPSNTSPHRRSIVPVAGRARIAQRFATDWIQMGADGKSFAGPQDQNRSYHAYGAEVLAVADGVVTEIHDAIPENVPNPSERAVPITLETIGGNHVILDIGGGHFATYLHLQPGSLRVKTGQRVVRGETLGSVGNSGNSSEPHLHFQVTDAGSVLGAEGLPYLLDSFLIVTPGGSLGRVRELPMRGEVVNFPGSSAGAVR